MQHLINIRSSISKSQNLACMNFFYCTYFLSFSKNQRFPTLRGVQSSVQANTPYPSPVKAYTIQACLLQRPTQYRPVSCQGLNNTGRSPVQAYTIQAGLQSRPTQYRPACQRLHKTVLTPVKAYTIQACIKSRPTQ